MPLKNTRIIKINDAIVSHRAAQNGASGKADAVMRKRDEAVAATVRYHAK
jgi:hypothetical protein